MLYLGPIATKSDYSSVGIPHGCGVHSLVDESVRILARWVRGRLKPGPGQIEWKTSATCFNGEIGANLLGILSTPEFQTFGKFK
jgi:hypothetical protein